MVRVLSSQVPECRGQKVLVAGWIHSRRDHGKLIFVDLRDKDGLVQVVCNPQEANAHKIAQQLRPEWVVVIEGMVKERPENMKNREVQTGDIEIEAQSITVLAEAKTPPFDVTSEGSEIGEDVRLKYRYLDLRRPRLQRNLKIRAKYVQAAREYLSGQGFLEIETPMLTKSTPEGSRDFVVPSRIYPGKFYALPQSPQQYKQLLMVAGFERYFQLARALRDEDPRADRSFEHTQIDLEMSFVTREDVMRLVEGMTIYAAEKIGARISQKPFPIITFQEALQKYGADKFDLRSQQEKKEGVLSFAWVVDFPFFEKEKKDPSQSSESSTASQSSGSSNWTFTHNPFSAPISPEHEQWLLNAHNIDKILTSQYDLVCNGLEVAGGSLRAHKPEVLRATFRILGYQDNQIEQNFGHMLEAFEYGVPPHGGCAQGFERLLMAYLHEEYLRDVQAFPQTGQGRTSVMEAPSALSQKQLKELHLDIQND